MAIFAKDPKIIGISDQMTLAGWTFDAQIVISEKTGNAAAIHSGRILSFQMNCCDEVVAYFDDGVWYQTPDPEFMEANLAKDLLIQKWSKHGDKEYQWSL